MGDVTLSRSKTPPFGTLSAWWRSALFGVFVVASFLFGTLRVGEFDGMVRRAGALSGLRDRSDEPTLQKGANGGRTLALRPSRGAQREGVGRPDSFASLASEFANPAVRAATARTLAAPLRPNVVAHRAPTHADLMVFLN